MDKISVIVPVYNAEKYLENCINSILTQTYENIELILVNDGSQDASLAICERCVKKYANIKLINKSNEGVIKARKDGMNIAEGKWVAFVDSDDTIDCTMYSEMMNILKENDADMCVLKKYTVKATKFEKEECVSALEAQRALCELAFPTSMWSGIYSLEIARKVIINDNIHFLEDFLFNYAILQKIDKVALCEGRYYNYTENAESINHQSINDKRMSCLQIADKLLVGGPYYCKEMERYIPFVIAHCLIANLVILKPNAKKERQYYNALKDYSKKYGNVIRKAECVPKSYKALTVLTAISPALVSYIMILKKLRRKK